MIRTIPDVDMLYLCGHDATSGAAMNIYGCLQCCLIVADGEVLAATIPGSCSLVCWFCKLASSPAMMFLVLQRVLAAVADVGGLGR
jgi:hypothetical protein